MLLYDKDNNVYRGIGLLNVKYYYNPIIYDDGDMTIIGYTPPDGEVKRLDSDCVDYPMCEPEIIHYLPIVNNVDHSKHLIQTKLIVFDYEKSDYILVHQYTDELVIGKLSYKIESSIPFSIDRKYKNMYIIFDKILYHINILESIINNKIVPQIYCKINDGTIIHYHIDHDRVTTYNGIYNEIINGLDFPLDVTNLDNDVKLLKSNRCPNNSSYNMLLVKDFKCYEIAHNFAKIPKNIIYVSYDHILYEDKDDIYTYTNYWYPFRNMQLEPYNNTSIKSARKN